MDVLHKIDQPFKWFLGKVMTVAMALASERNNFAIARVALFLSAVPIVAIVVIGIVFIDPVAFLVGLLLCYLITTKRIPATKQRFDAIEKLVFHNGNSPGFPMNKEAWELYQKERLVAAIGGVLFLAIPSLVLQLLALYMLLAAASLYFAVDFRQSLKDKKT